MTATDINNPNSIRKKAAEAEETGLDDIWLIAVIISGS